MVLFFLLEINLTVKDTNLVYNLKNFNKYMYTSV